LIRFSPQIYGTALNVSCLDSNPEANPKLFRGTTDVSSENGQNIILAAGTYNYKCNVSQTQNYTSAEDLDSFVISKASQTAELSINESSINYGQLVEAECNGDLFLDGANISAQIGEALLLSGGNHQFSCRLYENQNYSYDDDNQTISVIQNISITSVITDPVSSIVYGNFSNFSCFNSAGLTTSLYINGSLKNSEKGQEIVRAAGSYNVSCISTGNENFTGSFARLSITLLKLMVL
jgi:VCBS repeat-containing protein